MKIAIFTDTFFPMINGVVTAITNVVVPLAEKGHEFLIVTPKTGKSGEFTHPGVKIHRLKSFPARFYEDFRWTTTISYSTYKTMVEGGYELVHFMTPFTVSYLGIKLARMLNLPVIGTFHTFISDPSYSDQLFRGFIKPTDRMAWKYLSLFYNSADYVTAPCQSTLSAMRENGISVTGGVISNGIDASGPENGKAEEFRSRFNLGPRAILFSGRLAKEKNLLVLVEGFRRAWEEAPELQLLLVGDGPLKADLERAVKGQPFEDNVIFAGKIQHEELMASGIFEACWIFATASASENQPMTILEAQANGMVCIGADARGIPDLIEHERNGLLFSPTRPDELASAILELHRNEAVVEGYRVKTKEMVRNHHLPRVTDFWEKRYREVIEDYASGLFEEKSSLRLRSILSCARGLTISERS